MEAPHRRLSRPTETNRLVHTARTSGRAIILPVDLPGRNRTTISSRGRNKDTTSRVRRWDTTISNRDRTPPVKAHIRPKASMVPVPEGTSKALVMFRSRGKVQRRVFVEAC